MAEEEKEPSLIYEERCEQMIDDIFAPPTAKFLNPVAKDITQAAAPLFRLPQNHPKVLFKGWNHRLNNWPEWVDQMAGKYSSVWEQAGILDAIMSSIYGVTCSEDLISELVQFWSPKTNTFVFSWGEATITLEDVMILGGYSVLGDSINSPDLTEDSVKIVEEMNEIRLELVRSKSKKAYQSMWIRRFMERDHRCEHIAFLSLWLSRFVFPSFRSSIGKHVLPIAVKLSQGVKLALAPAILASIYNDLGRLKEQPADSSNCINLLGPFQLVQFWVYERFPNLGPKIPNELCPGEPRVARWDMSNSSLNLPLLKPLFNNPVNFHWRPYVVDLKNWRRPLYYQDFEQMVHVSSSLDDDLRSFMQFLQPCMLDGLNCKEKYHPHRVTMQFGFDQDVPADHPGYNLAKGNAELFIPSRPYKPSVSIRYSSWWKSLMVIHEDSSVLVPEESLANDSHCSIVHKGSIEQTLGSKLSKAAQDGKYEQEGDGEENSSLPCVHPSNKNLEETDTNEFDDMLMSLKNICSATKRKIDSLKASCVADQQSKKRMLAMDGVLSQMEVKGDKVGVIELSDGGESEGKQSVKFTKNQEKKCGGESFNNPIYVDNNLGYGGESLNNPIDVNEQFQRSIGKHKVKDPTLVILD